MRNTVGHADSSGDLRKLLENGKKNYYNYSS